MKIGLSRKDHAKGQHVVVLVGIAERADFESVVYEQVTTKRLVVEVKSATSFLYRFAMRHQETLLLAFPMAEVSPGLIKMLRRAEEKRLGSMVVPNLRIPGLRKTSKLYDYQKVAVARIVNGTLQLLNDEMGLGKTIVALSAIRKLKALPALVVCPNSAKFEWADQIAAHFDDLECVVVDGTKAERQEQIRKNADITVINIEGIRAKPLHGDIEHPHKVTGWDYANPALFEGEYEFCVIDEHHRLKTETAQATRGFFQLAAKQWLCMSGTPILNRVEEIWTVLHKLYPDAFPSSVTFVRNICIYSKHDSSKVVGYRTGAMQELRKFLDEISLRRRRDQVFDSLPPVIMAKRLCELTEEQRVLYNEIIDEAILRMENGEIQSIFDARVETIRLKQACFSPELYGGSPHSRKIEELKEIVRELVANGEKALVFSQWSKATRILQRELAEYNPAYVDGSVPVRERRNQIQKFRTDDSCHLYIGTIGANREAINLGNASYVIFTDIPWTPAEVDQAIGRSAAGGLRGLNVPAGTKVHVIELQAAETIEQSIEKMLARKRAFSDRLIERDAGKQVDRIDMTDMRSLLVRV